MIYFPCFYVHQIAYTWRRIALMHLTESRIARNPPQVSFLSRISVFVYDQGKNLY